MTIDDIGKMIKDESDRTAERFDAMNARFEHVDARFDSLEKRVMNIEGFTEEARGRFIGIDDRLAKVEYALDGTSPGATIYRYQA